MDRAREGEVYLDEKQKPCSFPHVFLCMCVGVGSVCVSVMSLHRDSLMVVGIVNRRSHRIVSSGHEHGGPIRWFRPDEKQNLRISIVTYFNHSRLAIKCRRLSFSVFLLVCIKVHIKLYVSYLKSLDVALKQQQFCQDQDLEQ